VLASTIWAPVSASCGVLRPLTVARVPTGMNRGVSTTPWGVSKRPVRARVRLLLAVMVKRKVNGEGPVGVLATRRLSGDARWMPDSSPRAALAAPLWLRDLAGAWIFYSVLPAWPRIAPRFERIARFAPWIGLVIGSLEALLWLLTYGWLPALAQCALVISLGLWLSGGLHADGVIDTADGLAAGPRALEAMADSRAGAAGVQAMALLLLLRLAALVALAAAAGPLLVAWTLVQVAIWSRISPLLAIAWFPYLREQGTAGFHRQGRRRLGRELLPAVLLQLLLALPVTLAAGSLDQAGLWAPLGLSPLGLSPLVVPLLLPALPALLLPIGLGRRLGGHSGDSYGACVEWTTSLALLLCGVALSAAEHWAAG